MHTEHRATHQPLENEALVEAMQKRLDQAPERLQSVEHPFGTLKAG